MEEQATLLNLPRELRDMISSNILTSSQPFQIRPSSTTSPSGLLATATPQPGLNATCKQLRHESAQTLRREAFTPGTRISATVYNFNFSSLIAFIRTLRPHEIAAANRHQTFLVELVNCDVTSVTSHWRVAEWSAICELWGVEIGAYKVAAWSGGEKGAMKVFEAVIGGMKEGRKILDVLMERDVKSWSWERWQGGLRAKI